MCFPPQYRAAVADFLRSPRQALKRKPSMPLHKDISSVTSISTPEKQPEDYKRDSQQFWKVDMADDSFWDAYLAARPNYSQDFYQRLYDYHLAHSESFSLAHDVGAGPGQVARQLATRFAHVVVSDNNDSSLFGARHRLAHLRSEQVEFTLAPAEKIADKYPARSADFLTAAECLPLIDAEAAMSGFARLLKPNGTLAVWFYGRALFSDDVVGRRCQPILDEILTKTFAKVIKGQPPAKSQSWRRATDRLESWLDDVRLDPKLWCDVERIKWNAHERLCFYGSGALDFDVTRRDAVEPSETVVEKRDPNFWREEWDSDQLREFVRVLFPLSVGESLVDAEIAALYHTLEEAMGGKGVKAGITWPVVLILATRK